MGKRLDNLEKLINTTSITPNIKEEIITESVERTLRARNLILANVPENSGRPDAEIANDVLGIIDPSVTVSPLDVIRLGKMSDNPRGRPHLLKLRFKNVETARLVLKKRIVLRSNPNFKMIAVLNDKMPNQLAHLKQLNSELQLRRRNGEKSLTIKYQNNVPQIIEVPNVSDNASPNLN